LCHLLAFSLSPYILSFLSFIFFFYSYGAHRDLHSFPTRRSSDLRRLSERVTHQIVGDDIQCLLHVAVGVHRRGALIESRKRRDRDRKSTRLNSSHLVISYAVFCLKKKKKNNKIHVYLNTKNHVYY